MCMKNKHIKLPWVLVSGHDFGNERKYYLHDSKNTTEIAELRRGIHKPMAEENGKFIIRACNSHYKMVHILHQIAEQMCNQGYINLELGIKIQKIIKEVSD